MDTHEQIQAIQRWQDSGTWQAVTALSEQALQFDAEADQLGTDARLLLDRGDVEQASQLKSEADHLRNCAATIRQHRSRLAGELCGIEHWIRNHRPDLLEFVPTAQFDGDHSEAIRDLKRLESRLSVPPAAEADDVLETDYAEPIGKSELAQLFGVDRKTIKRQLDSGNLRVLPGTLPTAKKIRVHGDDFPPGLKRKNERTQRLSELKKNVKRQ